MSAFTPTLTGRTFRFAEPDVSREDLFGEVAHGLALANRFAGQTSLPYSVAQHCVLGADAVMRETGDAELAAFFLLHDAHEAWIGDMTSPVLQAVCEAIAEDAVAAGVARQVAAVFSSRVRLGVARVKRTIDQAVVAAAGLSFARFELRAEEIELADIRMLRAERDALMGPQRELWSPKVEAAAPFKLRPARLKCWAWPEAEERYRDALARFCPLVPTSAALTA